MLEGRESSVGYSLHAVPLHPATRRDRLPVLLYLLAPAKASVVLDNVRAWLTVNNAVIMMAVLLVLGTQLLGKGLGSF